MPYVARLMIRQIIPLSHERLRRSAGRWRSPLRFRRGGSRSALANFPLVDFFDLNTVRQRQPSAISELDGGQQWRVRLRGEYARLHRRRDSRIRRPPVVSAIRRNADAESSERHPPGRRHRSVASGEPGARGARKFAMPSRGVVRVAQLSEPCRHGRLPKRPFAIILNDPGRGPISPRIRRRDGIKYGFGLNFEQDLTSTERFRTVGWNDGRNESFAYTEVDRTLELGADLAKGNAWRRRNDRAAPCFSLNAISAATAAILRLAGWGFCWATARLTYGPEKIFETFYTRTCGADSSLPSICSTSTIRDTTKLGGRCLYRVCGPTWTSSCEPARAARLPLNLIVDYRLRSD